MASTDSETFPLVEINAIANMQNVWVALMLRVTPMQGDVHAALDCAFGSPDLLAAIAPLDCIVALDSPACLNDSLLSAMPPSRVGFAIRADALADEAQRNHLFALQEAGHRILIDGPLPDGVTAPPVLRAVSSNAAMSPRKHEVLPLMFGPHLAYHVATAEQQVRCARIGYEWFAGEYPLHPQPSDSPDDGSSRKRLMTLLGLLARDAETRELEALLKQDPSLSYHLLKLANSAAFAHSSHITSFGQAISILGRRQLQRWLQLLLYARQQPDGIPNLLLPIAARRAAQMEMLCKLRGGEREAQDLAFMTGVFSLLNVLLAMPMQEIVGALNLPPIAADALLLREGPLGELLTIAETQSVTAAMLDRARLTPRELWQSQLHAYHWAIQVSRNL